MKDSYDLLNMIETNIEDMERVEMTELEKKKTFKKLTSGSKSHKKVKGIAAAAVVCVACLGMGSIPTVRAAVMSFFSGNTTSDYVEEVNGVVENDATKLEVLSVSRSLNEVTVQCKLNFDRDVSALKEACAEQDVPEGNVFVTKPFSNSSILVDDYDLVKNDAEPSPNISFMSCQNTEITQNSVTQTIKLYLNDDNYNENLKISLRYKDIDLGSEIITGEWYYDYILVAGKYTEELATSQIGIKATNYEGFTYTLDTFTVTPNGLKIFGTSDWTFDPSKEVVFPCKQALIRLLVTDDLGNQYLMYPRSINNDPSQCVYEIYDGPAVTDGNYRTTWHKDATKLTVAIQELLTTWESNTEFTESDSIISPEYEINLK